jgi:cytochrome c-type biogenesis protein CcmH
VPVNAAGQPARSRARRLTVAATAALLLAVVVAAGNWPQRRSAEASPPTVHAAGARLQGRVTLAPALQAQVQPDDTLFIFARVLDGPREPVALLRRRAGDLPLDFVLDGAAATNPTLRLSPSMRLVLGARISRSGSAEPHSGDLQGVLAPVGVGSQGLVLEIGSVLP